MPSAIIPGQTTWSMTRDDNGQRTYKIKFQVLCGQGDGPATIIQTPGLPQEGDFWIIDNDVDLWATCKQGATVTPKFEDNIITCFIVEFTFSTKPDQRCNATRVEDPLLEPQKVSGNFVKYTEEVTEDRFGKTIQTSSFQQIRGPQVEFDANRPTIRISQNVPDLQLELVGPMQDTLNEFEMWGLPPRCIKLSSFSWTRNFLGQCSVYFTREFEFDINIKHDLITGDIISGFDRDLLDESNMVLNGHWDEATDNWVVDNIVPGVPADHNNPAHYIQALDRRDTPIKVTLDGEGKPITKRVSGAIASITNPDNSFNPNGTWVITVTGAFTFTLDNTTLGPFPNNILVTTVTAHGMSTGNVVAISHVDEIDNIIPVSGEWENLSATKAAKIHVEKYNESDFLLLNVPTDFTTGQAP